ncbi:MAG: penicillin-binding protein 2 [Pseudomonadota bacterium]
MLVSVFFFVAIGALMARAVQLQIFEDSRLAGKASRQYEWSRTQQPRRGAICDRNLSALALSVKIESICAYPRLIGEKEATAKALSNTLGINQKELLCKLKSQKRFVWIKRHVGLKEAAKVAELNLPGIDFVKENRRFYPNKGLAAQLVGFTDIDGCGLEGLENEFDSTLKGKPINDTILKDAMGRIFTDSAQETKPINGYNLVLTLDKNIQYIAENALAEAISAHNAKGGMAIVVAPKTGELLAVANLPGYNPNIFWKSVPANRRNHVFTDTFEPGSTFKVFLAATALAAGSLTPESTFYCENGVYSIGRNTIHDVHKFGWLSLQDIIKKSSNIGAVKIGQKLDREYLDLSLRKFGFGQQSGVNVPSEASGVLRPYNRWTNIDAATVCFGQGVSVTVFQLAMALSAIANNGTLMKPILVKEIIDDKGNVVNRYEPTPIRQVVSPEIAHTITQILTTVVAEGGTGTKASLQDFAVAGKTGTAQKAEIGAKGYAVKKYVSSFIGFVPADDPEVTIVVAIDEPQGQIYGGVVAAPVFQKISKEILRYLNVIPTKGLMVSDETRQTS